MRRVSKIVPAGLVVLIMLSILALPVLGTNDGRYQILLRAAPTGEELQTLKNLCSATYFVFDEFNAVVASVPSGKVADVRALDFVAGVEPDTVVTADHAGRVAWDIDMIDADLVHGSPGAGTFVDGSGVFVAILDTGLVPNWEDYFPADRIATEYAMSFHNPNFNENKGGWTDTDGHGTHVTSTILGYSYYGLANFEGVAPGARVIPVKVLNNSGSGWGSAVAAGIVYVANLKASGAIDAPVVINMSLGSPLPDPLEILAIDYALARGVVIVASAGNRGNAGMGYPGGYPQVISAGATGWTSEWPKDANGNVIRTWWTGDVPEGDVSGITYVCGFSSRQKPEQDLDVLAPGSWVVGPYLNQGAAHPSIWANGKPGQYYFLGGTSMAAPHVTATVALMLQVHPDLTAAEAETILESTALPIPAPGSAVVNGPNGLPITFTWSADAVGSGLIQTDSAVQAAAALP